MSFVKANNDEAQFYKAKMEEILSIIEEKEQEILSIENKEQAVDMRSRRFMVGEVRKMINRLTEEYKDLAKKFKKANNKLK